MKKQAFTIEGRVEAVLVANKFDSIISTAVDKIEVHVGLGIKGDKHGGHQRLVDSREDELLRFGFLKGEPILNLRQFSALSVEELKEIAHAMGVSGIPPGYLGENLIVRGIPKFTCLPRGTRLFFKQHSDQRRSAVLMIWEDNGPCHVPGKALEGYFPEVENLPTLFRTKAVGRRGVVGLVLHSGFIAKGDVVIVQVPEQNMYPPD